MLQMNLVANKLQYRAGRSHNTNDNNVKINLLGIH